MKYKRLLLLGISLLIVLFIPLNDKAAELNVATTLSFAEVKIGSTISVDAKTEDVFYKSSDTQIAYVNNQGLITGKKPGIATIFVSKSGFKTKELTVKVLANGKLPNLLVSYDEVALQNLQVIKNETGEGTLLSAEVKNLSEYEAIEKVQYTFETKIVKTTDTLSTAPGDGTTDAEQPSIKYVTLQALSLNPGQTSETITCEGPSSGLLEDAKLLTVEVYSGKGLVVYNAQKNSSDFTWGIPDTTPPTISGMLDSNSYNKDDVFMVVYPDKKYDFTKYVKVSDDRDKTVQLNVDTSKIDWTQKGIYTVTFSAADEAGNTATANTKIQVRLVETIDQYADVILNKITKDTWSDAKKVEAIYTYVRKNLSYVDSNDHTSWEKSSLYGLKHKSGNCFVFYSLSKLLLTRCGIPNITIIRSKGRSHHWWNLVYVEDGWYHYDTTTMHKIAVTCLLTDKQLTEYSNKAKSEHVWESSAYPKRATKEISKVIMGKRY